MALFSNVFVARPLFWVFFFKLVSASPHRGIREQRAMSLLGLGGVVLKPCHRKESIDSKEFHSEDE